MGAGKNNLDFLRQPAESDGLDFLRTQEDNLDFLRQPKKQEIQPTDTEPPPEEHLIEPPDVGNILRYLPEDSTDIIIGVPSSDPTSVAGKFLRLIGAEQGFNQILTSDAFSELGETAEEMERSGSFGGMMFAANIRETQGNMLAGGTLLSVADFEERPRKAFFNILALHAQRKMDKVRSPRKEFDSLTFQDYSDAVADGWDARQRMSSVKSLSALLNPGSEVAWEEFLKRHPDFAKVANASDAVSDFGIAVLAEIAIGKGLGVLGKFAIKIPKARFTDSLDDVIERTVKNVVEAEGDDIIGVMIDRMNGVNPDVSVQEFAKFVDPSVKRVIKSSEEVLVETAQKLRSEQPGKFLYHGSPEGKLKSIDVTVHSQAWVEGIGFYTTENINVAKTYSRGRTATTPERKLFAQEVGDITIIRNKATNVLDMNAPADMEMWNTIADNLLGKDYIQTYIAPYTNLNTNKKVFTELRQAYKAEIGEDGIYGIYENFENMGIQATKHTEGGADNVHQVWIFRDRDAFDIIDDLPGQKSAPTFEQAQASVKIPVGVNSPDDLIKSMIYKRFIGDSILTKENPSGWIKQKDLDGVIKSATFKDVALEVVDDKAIVVPKKLGNLTFEELQDIAIELDSIKAMPSNFKKGVFATANRFSIAPPVRIFDTLGLGRQYARVADGIYNVKALRNQKIKWYADSMREYKKRFKKTWVSGDNKINQAWGRIMDNAPLEEWPDEILDAVSSEEMQWLTELAQDNRTIFYDPLRDEAIRQGRITSDTDLIAAGVPPVVDNYYHRIRLNVVRGLEDRRALAKAAGDDIKPLGFNAKDILKKDIKTEFKHGEFLARKAVEGDINYYGIDVDIRATQEIGRMLNIEPELKRMDAAIDALPVDLHGKQKAKAKGHFKSWVDQIRHVPAEIDLKLDSIFNAASNNIEKVVPRWEASERAFQNFAITSNRAVDRGLLKFKGRPTIRNLFQTQHNLHIYGPRSSLWGAEAIFTSSGQKLLRTSQAMVHRGIPIAALDITNQKRWASKLGKIDQATTYAGIAITDKYINVSNSILSGWHSYFSKNKRAFEELALHAKDMGVSRQSLTKERFADVVADAVSQGKFTDARRAIDFKGVALTQWLYDSEMMTPLMRSFAARSGLKYTTWQQNFWGGHMPQLIDQLFKGKDIFGMKPTLAQRTAIFQVIGKVGLAVYLAKEHGIDMTQVTLTGSVPAGRVNIEGVPREIPLPVSPVARGTFGALQLAIGAPKASTQVLEAVGQMRWGVLTEDNQIFEDGWKNFVNTMAAHVPASGAALQVQRVIEGDLPPEGILWPMPKKSKTPTTSKIGIGKKSLGISGKKLGL